MYLVQYRKIYFTILALIFCIGQIPNLSFAAVTDIAVKKNVTQGALPTVHPQIANQNNPPSTWLTISTDRTTFVGGQYVNISVKVYFSSAPPKRYVVDIEGMGVGASFLTDANSMIKTFEIPFYINPQQKSGEYIIKATMPEIKGNASPELTSSITIEVQDLFLTRTFIMFYILGVGGFIALIVVIALRQIRVGRKLDESIAKKQECEKQIEELSNSVSDEGQKNLQVAKDELAKSEISIAKYSSVNKSYELYRFICLSTIAIAPIAAIALTDVQITPTAPVGLITKKITVPIQNDTRVGTEWMINIGGIQTDHYSSGIQVPVNVVIFGIGGAYLRYLYKTATEIRGQGTPVKQDKPTSEQKSKQKHVEAMQTTDFFYESLKDIALFLLAPLLAIAVWLILTQGGMTSPFTLAAVSFGVGLVTNDIVNFIIGFMRKVTSATGTTQGD